MRLTMTRDMPATDRGPRDGAGRRSWAVRPVAVLVAVGVAGVVASSGAAPGAIQPPAVQEFVPIGDLPEEDRLPAAGFLIAAYSIVWILTFGYFWRLSRRQSEVEGELARLSRMLAASSAEEPPRGS